jgi:hydrogenase maturation protease
MSASASPLLVATFGNEMAGDDAFGPMVARALRTMALHGVEVVDLGMTPAALLDYLADRTAVCIVDAAIDKRLPPGTLVEADFFGPNRPQLVHERALSSHGLSVAGQLAMASGLGPLPDEVRIVAVTLGSAKLGRPVSKEVVRQVPSAARRIVEWALRRCGDTDETPNVAG